VGKYVNFEKLKMLFDEVFKATGFLDYNLLYWKSQGGSDLHFLLFVGVSR
jgi:uncharacterized membrane protein